MQELSLRASTSDDFEDVAQRVHDKLTENGFGVQLDMNIQDIIKEKLGVAFGKYRIFGACNPAYAHEGLRANKELGVVLPCNIIVYEDEGETIVSAIRPTALLGFFDNDEITEITALVEKTFKKIINEVT